MNEVFIPGKDTQFTAPITGVPFAEQPVESEAQNVQAKAWRMPISISEPKFGVIPNPDRPLRSGEEKGNEVTAGPDGIAYRRKFGGKYAPYVGGKLDPLHKEGSLQTGAEVGGVTGDAKLSKKLGEEGTRGTVIVTFPTGKGRRAGVEVGAKFRLKKRESKPEGLALAA